MTEYQKSRFLIFGLFMFLFLKFPKITINIVDKRAVKVK